MDTNPKLSLTQSQWNRKQKVDDAKEELAELEERRVVLLATIKAAEDNCTHPLKGEIFCCGKPEGSYCRVCGKRWE